MKDFNLRDYLYNNPLLKEEEEETPKGKKTKEEDIKEEKLRGYIRERITSILKEVDEEDVDIDIEKEEDIEDTEEEDIVIDDEETEIDTTIKTVTPGIENKDLAELDGILNKALEVAARYGNKNLTTQVSNTKIMADRITAKAMTGIE